MKFHSSQRSGDVVVDGGIRSALSSQSNANQSFAAKALAHKQVACFLMVAVICGYLATFGIRLSTDAAHSADVGLPIHSRSARRRERTSARTPTVAAGVVAASYARFSSDQQDVSSIDQQQRRCRDKALTNVHDLKSELEFTDESLSGTRLDRPGFNRMMAKAREGAFNVLYVDSLSRLSRELSMSIATLKELAIHLKIRVVSVSEGFDTNTPDWEINAFFRSWQHGTFLSDLREAVLRGQEGTIRDGFSVGDWPFGYTSEAAPGRDGDCPTKSRNRKARRLVAIHPTDAVWVRQIFDWFTVEQKSIAAIVRELTQRRAPKDHRSTKPSWGRGGVITVLRNIKYVGVWEWGKRTNVRHPLTGKLRQEFRPPEEMAKFTRLMPELRLVGDEQFLKAQGMLDENEARLRQVRAEGGRVKGSSKDSQRPRHLLQQLFRCKGCGSLFHVGGSNGREMQCSGFKRGTCGVKTRLNRKRATKLLLAEVAARVINNPTWHAAVLDAAQSAWEERNRTLPDEIRDADEQLKAVRRKVSSLLDAIECGGANPDIRERLTARQQEEKNLVRRRDQLVRERSASPTPPTSEWVADKIRKLHELLDERNAAAAVALRELVGPVVLEEIPIAGRKRKLLRGTFTVRSHAITGDANVTSEEVTLDFVEPRPWATVADSVKQLFDEGVSFAEMAKTLEVPRCWPAKALAFWFRSRGQTPPDGRTEVKRLKKPKLAAELADRANDLYAQGLLMKQIAMNLGCCMATALAAVKHWHSSRGLEMPDGRARRKTLVTKSALLNPEADEAILAPFEILAQSETT